MEENKEPTIFYKLMGGKKVRVFKNTYNDKNYYKVQVTQKQFDGQVEKFYKPITFKKNVELDNETDIIIEEGFENLRANPKDPYNPISTINVTKFTICERQEQLEQQAYEDFRDNLDELENGIDVTDDMLPF